MAEERHALNQQQQQLVQQLQEQVSQLSAQLTEVNAKLHSQQQLLNEKEKEFHALSSEKQQLENELTNNSLLLDELRAKVAVSVENYEQLSLKHEKMKKDHGKVKSEISFIGNKLILKDEVLSSKQAEIDSLQRLVATLDDKYKKIIREKLIIEGN